MDVAVRQVAVDDAADLVAILNPIVEAGVYTALDQTFTVDEEREFISRFPERGVFNVAVSRGSGRVVGFQNVEPFAAFTRAFDHVGIIGTYVQLESRRQGIAGRLFEATFAGASGRGFEKLFTYVRSDNPAALQAYVSRGFEIVGTATRHARILGRYVDEIIIEKQLDGSSWTPAGDAR
jgi:L-amino acid N-acyltransferase YncA